MNTVASSPQSPAQPPAQAAPQPRSHKTGAIAIVTAVVGGFVLLGLTASVSVAAAVSLSDGGSGATASEVVLADISGITAIDAEIGAASLVVEFADTPEATLETSGYRADRWVLERDDDELVVKSPERNFGGSCVFGVCPADRGEHLHATLTLPIALERAAIDADFFVGAGHLTATGAFGDIELSVGAGAATVDGSAESLTAAIDVGSFTADLAGVDDVHVAVAVGDATVTLRETPPRRADVQVDLGSVELNVPAGSYAVDARSELGEVVNRLRGDASATHTITARASLGDITLQETE